MSLHLPVPEKPVFLLSAACFVIVVAGLREAAELVVPFLLAAFIAIICSGPLVWMQRRKVPTPLAVLIIISVVVLIGVLIATFVGSSLTAFSENVPLYQQRIEALIKDMIAWLDAHGMNISSKVLTEYFDPRAVIRWTAKILSSFGGLLTNTFLILMTVIFILFEVASMPDKIRHALPNADNALAQLDTIMSGIKRYLGLKTVTSLMTGIAVVIWLSMIGIDSPMLWGLLAFALNFIPNIGSFIAAVPPVLLATLQLGAGDALLAALGYVIINTVVGNVIEPKMMGRGMGLSTLVVFVSLVFWGWVLGPVGMLLSVPLTMIMRIALGASPRTHWMAVILGPEDLPSTSSTPSMASTTSAGADSHHPSV